MKRRQFRLRQNSERENERKKTTARLLSVEPIIAVCRRQLQSNFTHLFTRRHTQQTRMIGPFSQAKIKIQNKIKIQ